jgi:hypothetical protein
MRRRTAPLLALALACTPPDEQPPGPTSTGDATTDATTPTTTGTTTAAPTPTDPGDPGSSTGDPCDPTLRSEDDRPDDDDRPQVHVVYAVPSDGPDRGFDVDGTLAGSVAVWNAWLVDQTRGSGLRLDTCGGVLDVTFFRMPQTDAEIAAQDPYIRDVLDDALVAAGKVADHKLYAVYYDGASSYSCGGGAWPPLLVGRVAALYLRGEVAGFPPCPQAFAAPGEPPTYVEFAMLHEIVHTLGLVADCAPHSDGYAHTDDTPKDLLYTGPKPWQPETLDPDHDDYFLHEIEDCPDLADSALLDPSISGEELPFGW